MKQFRTNGAARWRVWSRYRDMIIFTAQPLASRQPWWADTDISFWGKWHKMNWIKFFLDKFLSEMVEEWRVYDAGSWWQIHEECYVGLQLQWCNSKMVFLCKVNLMSVIQDFVFNSDLYNQTIGVDSRWDKQNETITTSQ